MPTINIERRLKQLPENVAVAVCEFPTIRDAANTVIQAMQRGVQIGRVELLDDVMMKGNQEQAVTPISF
jgi:D-lactate dehydrogenase (cytochrome)